MSKSCCSCWPRPAVRPKRNDVIGHVVTQEQLQHVLRRFAKAGKDALHRSAAAATGRRQETLDAACKLVEALLAGVQAHLPDIVSSVCILTGDGCSNVCDRFHCLDVIAAVVVRFHVREVKGEIATRSRIGAYIRLNQEVCFGLVRPTADVTMEPLRLVVSGWEMPALPETGDIRRRLKQLFGDRFCKQECWKWWLKHRNREYPLEKSKMRRIHGSGFEGPPMSVPPAWAAEIALWGYLHSPSIVYESFDFYDEGKAGIRVTARVVPSDDPDEIRCREVIDEAQREAMPHRSMTEKFLRSSINMGALTHGRKTNSFGADPAAIAKLFSAARAWGPGKRGWQVVDDTWLCTDIKNPMGRVVEEQGRLIWITPGEEKVPRTPGERRRWPQGSSEADTVRSVQYSGVLESGDARASPSACFGSTSGAMPCVLSPVSSDIMESSGIPARGRRRYATEVRCLALLLLFMAMLFARLAYIQVRKSVDKAKSGAVWATQQQDVARFQAIVELGKRMPLRQECGLNAESGSGCDEDVSASCADGESAKAAREKSTEQFQQPATHCDENSFNDRGPEVKRGRRRRRRRRRRSEGEAPKTQTEVSESPEVRPHPGRSQPYPDRGQRKSTRPL